MRLLIGSAAAAIVLCGMSLSGAAQAGEFTGQALAEACAGGSEDRGRCLAYIEGFAAGYVHNDASWTGYVRDNVRAGYLAVAAKDQRVSRSTYCADDAIPAEVVRRDYLKWAAANPGALGRAASVTLFAALAEAYPCRAVAPSSAEAAANGEEDSNG